MAKTIEELMAERKQIDAQIKEIKERGTVYGKAKLGIDHYPTAKPDEWVVSLWVGNEGKKRWRSVIRGLTRDEVINAIPNLIDDLHGLYALVKLDGRAE